MVSRTRAAVHRHSGAVDGLRVGWWNCGTVGFIDRPDEAEADVGFDTKYLGFLTITPPLNEDEVTWLRAWAEWIGVSDRDDLYDVPPNPRAAVAALFDRSAHGAVASSALAPRAVGDWRVGTDGTFLRWEEQERSNNGELCISFLIDHFLRDGALAASSGHPAFTRFTFDHELDGVIAAERNDLSQLYLIEVARNEVSTTTIVPGMSPW